jgi:hypothetical protein
MARRVQQRRAAVRSLTVDHLLEQQFDGKGAGSSDEGEHHRVPPPDPPCQPDDHQHGQHDQRPDTVRDRGRDPVAPNPDDFLPAHHLCVGRIGQAGSPDEGGHERDHD